MSYSYQRVRKSTARPCQIYCLKIRNTLIRMQNNSADSSSHSKINIQWNVGVIELNAAFFVSPARFAHPSGCVNFAEVLVHTSHGFSALLFVFLQLRGT